MSTKHVPFKPVEKLTLVLNPTCYMLNSLAMGDVLAAVPVVKHMIDAYHKEPSSYMVVAKEMFRPFFHFVPDANFHNFEDKDNAWGIPEGFAICTLNQSKVKVLTRMTPRMMHLGQFAAIRLANRIFPEAWLNYVPLQDVDVSEFGVDFSKAVILISSYRDLTRAWPPESLLETAAYIEKRGYIPVFVGKTDMNMETHLIPKTCLPDKLDIGVDLRNKTNIPQLASIIKQSKAICGLDSGPIHLAGTTATPIICGFTSISPEHRVPYRKKGKTYTIVPNIPCIGCESRWNSHFWNWENCYLKHIDCCKSMTSDKFIEHLRKIL